MITYLGNISQYYTNQEIVCATIFAVHIRSYNLQTPYQFISLLGRHHYLQRSNVVNKFFSKITNGESKSDVAVNLPEVCRTQVVCAKKQVRSQRNNYRLSAHVSSDTSAQPYWGKHIYVRIHE